MNKGFVAQLTIKSIQEDALCRIIVLGNKFQFSTVLEKVERNVYDVLLIGEGKKYTDVDHRMGLLTAYLVEQKIQIEKTEIKESEGS